VPIAVNIQSLSNQFALITTFSTAHTSKSVRSDEVDLKVFLVFCGRYLFWSEWGFTSSISRTGMDGSVRMTVISTRLAWPNALTVDYDTNKLWWGDAHLDYIESVTFLLFILILYLTVVFEAVGN